MTIRIYDLAALEDDRLFSPYCWRTKLALAHKGLAFESIPWRFTDKAALEPTGFKTVPVIVDGDRTVGDSWKIALYLEENYADRPALFGGPQSRALSLGFKNWVDRAVHLPMLRAVLLDLYNGLAEKDKPYFREAREKRFGMALEAFAGDQQAAIATVSSALDPVRATLTEQPFVCGSAPAYADYILFGAFMWTRSTSPAKLLAADDPLHAWRERMLDLHGGLARKARGYPV